MIISYFNPSYDCCLCISLDALHESLSPCILLVSSYFSCLFHMPFRFPLLSHYYSRMIVMRIFFFWTLSLYLYFGECRIRVEGLMWRGAFISRRDNDCFAMHFSSFFFFFGVGRYYMMWCGVNIWYIRLKIMKGRFFLK